MKKILIAIGIIVIIVLGCKREEPVSKLPCGYTDSYYYHDEITSAGPMSTKYIIVGFDSINTTETIKNFIKTKDYLDQNFNYDIYISSYGYKYAALRLSKEKTWEEITWIINDLEKSSITSFANYTIYSDGWQYVCGYGKTFYAKLKDSCYLSTLNELLSETNTRIVRHINWDPNTFIISTDKYSKGDVLKMAKYFYETGLFKYVDPNLFYLYQINTKEADLFLDKELVLRLKSKAQDTVIINENRFVLDVSLIREFSPICPPNGQPMMSNVILREIDSVAIPKNIDLVKQYVILKDSIWFSNLSKVNKFNEKVEYQLWKHSNMGPKWGPNILADVIVAICDSITKKEYLIRKNNVFVQRICL
jgi:hypothetical protein